jgi:hypothetical protein
MISVQSGHDLPLVEASPAGEIVLMITPARECFRLEQACDCPVLYSVSGNANGEILPVTSAARKFAVWHMLAEEWKIDRELQR